MNSDAQLPATENASSELVVLTLKVRGIRIEADSVRSFELSDPSRTSPLPAFTAGSHLDVVLPDGGRRSYSLLNDPAERHRYVVAVRREAASRGGSSFLCDTVRVGDTLRVTAPANHFALHEDASASILIGGGIGITPLLSMIARLEQLGRPWQLHYAARSRAEAPFLDRLAPHGSAAPDRVQLHLGDEGGARMDIAALVRSAPADAHFYCCGPERMMEAFRSACAGRPDAHVHLEYFSAGAPVAAGGFEVVLARTGRSVRIPDGQTILETLLAAGMNLPRSCMEGVCGTCETVVLEGVPDHRDNVLSAREKRSNRKMIICRSGCIGERLVLDI